MRIDQSVLSLAVEGKEDDPRQERRKEQQARCDVLRGGLANELPPEARDQGADKGCEKDNGFHIVFS